MNEQDALLGAKVACLDCQPRHGVCGVPTMYPPINGHGRHGEETVASSSPSVQERNDITASRHQDEQHSSHFCHPLSVITYTPSEVHVVPSQEWHPLFLQQKALNEPVLITGNSHGMARLDAPFPALDATVVAELLAANRLVWSTDVATQTKVQLTALTWSRTACPDQYQEKYGKADTSVANAEFQVFRTPLQRQVAPPVAVTRVDWRYLLTSSRVLNGGPNASADVFGAFLECNSYLDFTLAPGGQCMWLSVSAGELGVYLIPPSTVNYQVYQAWKHDQDGATGCLVERVDTCIKCSVSTGSTLLIPAGWIFARYAGGVQSCSLFYGFFTCISAMAAQLGVVLLEMQHETLVHYWHHTTSGWSSVDVNAQLWTALRFYWNQLLLMHNGLDVQVSDQDRQALQRAIPRLREWSAHPASLKSTDRTTWVPSSQHEAQAIVDRVEQALAAIDLLTHNAEEDSQLTAHLGSDSKLPTISLNEASYIYSAASEPDSDSGSVWATSSAGFDGSITSNFSSLAPMGTMWASFDPLQQQLRSTSNQPYVSNSPRCQDRVPRNDSPHYDSASCGYKSPKPGREGSTGILMPTSRSKQGLSSIRGIPTYPVDAANTSVTSAVGSNFHQLQSNCNMDYVDMLKQHRASCHRCGNLRKKNVWCPTCPHIFCARCADKMHEEHGDRVFENGCPVCKELCCCGKNRTLSCLRMFHCYKKCPSTKRSTGG
uniref:RING-type domain-containing protein n=1 Tax=Peronospora matthiolae TaxID=2874970 RepID=A0AAV1VGB1_9STRA